MTIEERKECIRLMGRITRAFIMYRVTSDYSTFETELEDIVGTVNEMLYIKGEYNEY